ncbi:hypothetical protein RAS12_11990 [Achromobacter seleniivolatilans]|uniref:Uncharacterized protein n=1 Tax=Achromobacter seleniivolatilans TaxID=3047478 RepID=A0ABY9M8W4_9BURK|nr:hypothetical protein [Achromobacter sp. R39]WMD23058.1 hypothetical protein RAS12_11990 [Achromobacter sp. R39]
MDSSTHPAAVPSLWSEGGSMQVPRMVMPLSNYQDSAGAEYEVVLYQAVHEEEPRIKVLKWAAGVETPIHWMDFSIAGQLQIELKDEPVRQVVGDSTDTAELSAERASDAIKLALRCLPPTAGRFQIVWVPDDGLPF